MSKCATCGMLVVSGNHKCHMPASRPSGFIYTNIRQGRITPTWDVLGNYKSGRSLKAAICTNGNPLHIYWTTTGMESFAEAYDVARLNLTSYASRSSQEMSDRLNKIAISDLATATIEQRDGLLSDIWSSFTVIAETDRKVKDMVDPGSISGSRSAHRWLSIADLMREGISEPFAGQGYCFRCDTRPPASVTDQGFKIKWFLDTPKYLSNTSIDEHIKGKSGARKILMWDVNVDGASEGVVCVSRTLRSCAKFPSQTTANQQAYFYALKLPLDKLGFDTEQWQSTVSDRAVWLGGEKGFMEIEGTEVIGSVPIIKQPPQNSTTGLFRFQIANNASWTYTSAASTTDRTRLDRELAQLKLLGLDQTVLQSQDYNEIDHPQNENFIRDRLNNVSNNDAQARDRRDKSTREVAQRKISDDESKRLSKYTP